MHFEIVVPDVSVDAYGLGRSVDPEDALPNLLDPQRFAVCKLEAMSGFVSGCHMTAVCADEAIGLVVGFRESPGGQLLGLKGMGKGLLL